MFLGRLLDFLYFCTITQRGKMLRDISTQSLNKINRILVLISCNFFSESRSQTVSVLENLSDVNRSGLENARRYMLMYRKTDEI